MTAEQQKFSLPEGIHVLKEVMDPSKPFTRSIVALEVLDIVQMPEDARLVVERAVKVIQGSKKKDAASFGNYVKKVEGEAPQIVYFRVVRSQSNYALNLH